MEYEDIEKFVSSLKDDELEYLNTCHEVVWYNKYLRLLASVRTIFIELEELRELLK